MGRLIAWILSIITALINNLGFWQQPETIYTGDPGYAIQADAINYAELQEWYIDTMVGGNASCNIKPKPHQTETTTNGVGYIIANKKLNPDAIVDFSDEDVIVAPGRCKITTQPNSSPNKIVVQNDERGVFAFKMEINNPKRWFCCENATPTAMNTFRHSQNDHRITLERGDTICVASSDTTIKLYRGTNSSGLKAVGLRDFLRANDNEFGDNTLYLNGEDHQNLTSTGDTSTSRSLVKIPSSQIYTGPSGWQRDSNNRWWWGRSGTAKIDWPAEQYILYDKDYYYFDKDGYMVTGWYNDYYFQTKEDAYDLGISDFKQGALCFDTVVPDMQNDVYYYYVGKDGKIEKRTDTLVAAENAIYKYVESNGKYCLSSSNDVNTGVGESVDSDNNQAGPDIGTQEKTYKELTQREYENICKEGMLSDTTYTNWATYKGRWLYLTNGKPADPLYKNYTTSENEDVYLCNIANTDYFFRTLDHTLICGTYSNPIFIANHNVKYNCRYMVIGDNGTARDLWYLTTQGWIYATETTGQLVSKSIGAFPTGALQIKGEWYAFTEEGYLDTTTPVISHSLNGQTIFLHLNTEDPAKARIPRNTK